MKSLQHLYEVVLRRKLDRANFQKKMLKLDMLEKIGAQPTGKSHRSPFFYKFNKRKYHQLLEEGIGDM